ncbi:mannosyltransferase family protein [Dactylosporangium sp. NPDC000244]|uniref:mannosyltransferase family protein n=1 Tax=Dactylosporangium sp. NPDC000244 TaxID=3154365 RepID=UPI003319462D
MAPPADPSPPPPATPTTEPPGEPSTTNPTLNPSAAGAATATQPNAGQTAAAARPSAAETMTAAQPNAAQTETATQPNAAQTETATQPNAAETAAATQPGASTAAHHRRRKAPGQRRPTSAGSEPDAAGDRPWRRAALVGGGAFAASRAGLAAVSVFAWIGDQQPHRTPSQVARLWASQWDSKWFVAIAEHGYQPTPDASPAAFFPLYPLLIRAATPLCLGRAWVAALLVANGALLAALILLYRLTDLELGRAAAARATFYLVAFPTGFFLSAAYNEGLFLALMLATVYCLRRRLWWSAAALGALAATTRSAGILLAAAFAFEYVRVHRGIPAFRLGAAEKLSTTERLNAAEKLEGAGKLNAAEKLSATAKRRGAGKLRGTGNLRHWSEICAFIGIPCGLGAVMIVNQKAYGDPLAFSHTQAAHWGRHLTWPWVAPMNAARHAGPWFTEIWAHNVLELTTVATLAVLLIPWLRRTLDQAIYPMLGLALVAFMVSFPSRYTSDIPYPLYSASRIGLEVFPAFMALGALGRRPWLDRAVLATFLSTQGVLAAHFLHSGWVA